MTRRNDMGDSTNETEYRDRALGRALDDLDVPDHRAEFFADLWSAVAEEAAGRGSQEPTPGRRLRRGGRWLRPLVAAAAAAVLVAAVIAATGAPWRSSESVTASAGEVKARVAQALFEAPSVKGRLTLVDQGSAADQPRERRLAFTASARGDIVLIDLGGGSAVAYDAGTGVTRVASADSKAGGNTRVVEQSGLAPGLPDPAPTEVAAVSQLGSVVRAVETVADARVHKGTYRGGRVLVLTGVVGKDGPRGMVGRRLEVTVDEASGLPLAIVAKADDAGAGSEVRVDDLDLTTPLPTDELSLVFPKGAKVERLEGAFRRVRLDQVATVVGYQPLVPSDVPEGFVLREVAVARESAPTGLEGTNPVSLGVASLCYRRGLERFVVSTRLVGASPKRWSDPLALPGDLPSERDWIAVVGGALDGKPAEVVASDDPHLWALTDDLVVTVAGDLTSSELRQIAGSLQRGVE